MSEQTLKLWMWLNSNPQIFNPLTFDEFLGLGIQVHAGEAQVQVNGIPVDAVVFSPNGESNGVLRKLTPLRRAIKKDEVKEVDSHA